MVIKYLYALFIGLLVSLFIGMGISTFYSRPAPPETKPIVAPAKEGDASQSAEFVRIERENQKAYEEYNKANKIYNRNASMIALAFAVVILIISLTLIKNLQIISDGLLLGGIFTLIYCIILGIESEDTKFRFAVVSIGLIISLIIGWLKFVKPQKKIN